VWQSFYSYGGHDFRLAAKNGNHIAFVDQLLAIRLRDLNDCMVTDNPTERDPCSQAQSASRSQITG
jgi:hypothetical protein